MIGYLVLSEHKVNIVKLALECGKQIGSAIDVPGIMSDISVSISQTQQIICDNT